MTSVSTLRGSNWGLEGGQKYQARKKEHMGTDTLTVTYTHTHPRSQTDTHAQTDRQTDRHTHTGVFARAHTYRAGDEGHLGDVEAEVFAAAARVSAAAPPPGDHHLPRGGNRVTHTHTHTNTRAPHYSLIPRDKVGLSPFLSLSL